MYNLVEARVCIVLISLRQAGSYVFTLWPARPVKSVGRLCLHMIRVESPNSVVGAEYTPHTSASHARDMFGLFPLGEKERPTCSCKPLDESSSSVLVWGKWNTAKAAWRNIRLSTRLIAARLAASAPRDVLHCSQSLRSLTADHLGSYDVSTATKASMHLPSLGV